RTPGEKAIEHKLMSPSSVNFKETPLRDAIDYLRTQNAINIVPDVAALKEAGVSLEQPLSLAVENVSLKSILNTLANQVNLTWMIKDEMLQITTHERAVGKYKQVVYPVADLVVPVPDYPVSEVNSFQAAMQRQINNQSGMYQLPSAYPGPMSLPGGTTVSSPGGGSGHGPYQQYQNGQGNNPQATVTRSNTHTIEDTLINLIQTTVAPTTWKDVGGQG